MRIIKLFTAVLPLAACLALSASPAEELNRLLQDNYRRHDLTPVKRATDEIFLRRTMLNINGKLPTAEEVRTFAADPSPDKREKLIQKLLDSPGFADVGAWRFADMFRIKSEFPINLWPNAVQAYHRFFRDADIQNRPWDALCRELITASGSNFRVPAANFFRASADRSPDGLAKAAALSLMGIRVEKLPKNDRKAFAAFFSRISFKSTDEWKEEVVFLNPGNAVIRAGTPDGRTFTIKTPASDPRTVFADWLLAEENPFFARAFVNRAWHWLFGRGLIDPADDMPLPRNFWQKTFGIFNDSGIDPGNEKILNYLAGEFRKNRYDIKKLFALIMNSCAYNADWKTLPAEQQKAEKYFAVYGLRRLEAELLVDAYSQILGAHESYSSVIPEPFTFLPKNTPAIAIADGSISSRTLDNFGKPSRDSGSLAERNNSITPSQRLFLMNSNWIFSRTQQLPRRVFQNRKLNEQQKAEELYLTILSRKPEAHELEKIMAYRKKLRYSGRIWQDLAWALINTKEFLYHH